jgi:hypothetical protein
MTRIARNGLKRPECFRSLVTDLKESIPPAYVAWRAGTSNRVVVPARQAGNRSSGSLKGLQTRAQDTDAEKMHEVGSKRNQMIRGQTEWVPVHGKRKKIDRKRKCMAREETDCV